MKTKKTQISMQKIQDARTKRAIDNLAENEKLRNRYYRITNPKGRIKHG